MNFHTIDWSATGVMFSGIGGFLTPIAVLGTAWAARHTYDEWKRREKFKLDREIAIDALSTFDEAREAINAIRSPFTSAEEQGAAERMIADANVALSAEGKHDMRQRIVVLSRIQRDHELWQKIAKLGPRLGAVFGREVKGHLRELLVVRQRIWAAGEMFRPNPPLDLERRRQFEAVIWQGAANLPGETFDQIDKQLDDAHQKLEDALAKHVR